MIPPETCQAQAVLQLLSGKWKLVVLWVLRDGPLRFGEVRDRIDGISEKVLTQQLRALERDGLVARTAFPEIPPRVEYRLAPRACDLVPVLNELSDWGREHLTLPDHAENGR